MGKYPMMRVDKSFKDWAAEQASIDRTSIRELTRKLAESLRLSKSIISRSREKKSFFDF